MIRVGLNVAKRSSLEDNAKQGPQIFESEQQKRFLDLFREQNLFTFIENKNCLSDQQRATIFHLTKKQSFANFLFFCEKGTTMTEEEIMDAIILYHKVQKGADAVFANKSNDFINSLKQGNC